MFYIKIKNIKDGDVNVIEFTKFEKVVKFLGTINWIDDFVITIKNKDKFEECIGCKMLDRQEKKNTDLKMKINDLVKSCNKHIKEMPREVTYRVTQLVQSAKEQEK